MATSTQVSGGGTSSYAGARPDTGLNQLQQQVYKIGGKFYWVLRWYLATRIIKEYGHQCSLLSNQDYKGVWSSMFIVMGAQAGGCLLAMVVAWRSYLLRVSQECKPIPLHVYFVQ